MKGYTCFKVKYPDGKESDLDEFISSIHEYHKQERFSLICKDDNSAENEVIFQQSGCSAKKGHYVSVINETVPKYNILKNKGFYLEKDFFVETLISCWKSC